MGNSVLVPISRCFPQPLHLSLFQVGDVIEEFKNDSEKAVMYLTVKRLREIAAAPNTCRV